MSLPDFFNLVKDSSFNISQMYDKAPNLTLALIVIVLLVVFLIYFFTSRTIKRKNLIKLIEDIPTSKNYDEYIQKVKILVSEIPKRGEEVASVLNSSKGNIVFLIGKLFASLDIKDKIDNYILLSKEFKELSLGSKKYTIPELTKFFEEKSKDLLENNLNDEIIFYIKNCSFEAKDIDNINSVIKYANSLENPNLIIDLIKYELDRFSFGYNLALYKFIEKLDKDSSKQIFEYCNDEINNIFESGKIEVSINILDYMCNNSKKQIVYDYISSLELKSYLQQLCYLYFNKKDDINLDLAFIANSTKIESNYKEYIDQSLTSNWKNDEHIKFLSNSKGVLEVLGHIEFRNLIERVENINIQKKNEEKIDEALKIAKRAESIALEAKSLNKRPLDSKKH